MAQALTLPIFPRLIFAHAEPQVLPPLRLAHRPRGVGAAAAVRVGGGPQAVPADRPSGGCGCGCGWGRDWLAARASAGIAWTALMMGCVQPQCWYQGVAATCGQGCGASLLQASDQASSCSSSRPLLPFRPLYHCCLRTQSRSRATWTRTHVTMLLLLSLAAPPRPAR